MHIVHSSANFSTESIFTHLLVSRHVLWHANVQFCFSLILLFLQCMRVLQCFFKAVAKFRVPRDAICLLQSCLPHPGVKPAAAVLPDSALREDEQMERSSRRRGRDWFLLNTEHQRDTNLLVGLITFLSLDHCSRTCGRLGGFLVLVFVCIIYPALMSCGKDAFSWWSACWAHRWAQTQRSYFLTPPITFVPGAGSKGPTGESSNTRY